MFSKRRVKFQPKSQSVLEAYRISGNRLHQHTQCFDYDMYKKIRKKYLNCKHQLINLPMKSSADFSLTHCRLNELSQIMFWKLLISILGMSGNVI